ncbi:MAG: hypothetical protein A3I05_04965 [Deltaproteobacteria bacterium RIFCSPLOWO2_02_FULL_44_10]|nr:MAG: hypothetical protein A3I05_04965 [Deltaproteobacteria bacterium RIFCSPLOWO2_02_FULL_44_10]
MSTSKMQTAFLVFFAALTLLFLALLWPFAKPAFLALTLTIVFAPLYRFILHKCRLHRYLASVLTTLIIAACVLIPLIVLGTVLVTHVGSFLQNISYQLAQGSFSDVFQPILQTLSQWIERLTGTAPFRVDLEQEIFKVLQGLGKSIYNFSPRVLLTTFSIIFNFFLILLFLVVFFAEGVQLHKWLMEASPLSSLHLEKMLTEMRLTITTSLTASLLIAVVQGSLLGLGFWIVGFNHPYSWWPIAIILSVIPIIGAVSCYITASLILLATGQTEWSIAFFVYGVAIVSSVDNIIRPFLVRGTTRIHPVLLFVTLIGAAKLFGPIGIIVGPVLLSIFLAAVRIYRLEFAAERSY